VTLTPGARLGVYEITAQIGEGGMGQVFRARDTKLDRDVAIKVLPEAFAHDADRLARFQREAKTLASLNHPHIAGIYGLEESAGITALVMELVEGEDLSQKIEGQRAQGKGHGLPIDEALAIAKQIADALEAAHEQGIIHRDLKPANIKVRPDGTVKVLDFGLAKAMDQGSGIRDQGSARASMSPTITTPAMTAAGMILGTAAYMSPEQAKGRTVDRRADIWAFGVLLCEMLTGTRPFGGDDVQETFVAILRDEPRWSALPSATPVALRRLLVRCLKKDPKTRLRDMGEARILIEEIMSGVAPDSSSESPKPGWRRMLLPAIAGAAIAASAVVALWAPWRATAPPPELVRMEIPAPEKTLFDNALLLSPDGRKLAFTTGPSSEGGRQIWVRSLDTVQARRVAPWSSNPVPFWSPDSRFIAYQQDGKLKKVDITGGQPTTLSDAPTGFGGGAWSHDIIVLGDRVGGLLQVPAGGGVPTPLTTLDATRQESAHDLPSFLPDGKHFVYLRQSSNPEYRGIYVGAVGTAPDQQDTKRLIAIDSSAVYTSAPDPRDATRGLGFLLFVREGTLMAQPFDAAALALKGQPVPVAEQVGITVYGLGRFSASQNGGLAYSASGTQEIPTRLVWVDRHGKSLGAIGQAGHYNSLSISPDGSRVAAERSEGQDSDLWLIDSAPGGKSDRFTFGPATKTSPVWSPDGTQVAFAAATTGSVFNLFRKPTNMASDQVTLLTSNDGKFPADWSRDGKTLLFSTSVGSISYLWSLALDGAKAEVFLKTDAGAYRGKLSPDGRWMAYVSSLTGRAEVYVRPFPLSPDRTGQQLVSNRGGNLPLWRRDGKELFYVQPPNSAMAVDVTTGSEFRSSQPRELFALPGTPPTVFGQGYPWGVTADGSRFLLNLLASENAQQIPISVVLNWTAGLKK
jgi:serine/threonine protein kinase/Tol biopolymer transport system component